MPSLITVDEIAEARQRAARVVLETPLMPTTSFSAMAGRPVYLKAENLQRTGSFKIRGAMNALARLPTDQQRAGVVAASAGNHAQGVALAARELDMRATVFMPESAAIPKVQATRGYGADVRLAGADLGESVDHAMTFAAETGARFIHPYDDRDIVMGQGTLGLELVEQIARLHLDHPPTVVVPVGGGGLVSGTATVVKERMPGAAVVGVHATAVPTYLASRRAGRPVTVEPHATVADGIACHRPSELAFALIERYVDEIVTVEDIHAMEAVALLLERAKLLVEPSGAVGLAAVLQGVVPGSNPVVVVLSGGNIDLLLLDTLVRHGLEARGRFASFKVWVPDVPGQLAAVLHTVGHLGGNVLSVEHHREGTGLPYGMVEIQLSIATRSTEHYEEILSALAEYHIIGNEGDRSVT